MLTALSGPKDIPIGPECRRVSIRIFCALWSLAFLMLLSPVLRAQDSPEGSQTPHAAASKTQGGDVLWYGNAPPGWGGGVGSMKLLAPGVGWAERGGRLYWTTENGANWTDITPTTPRSGEHIADIFFLDAHHGWVLFAQYGEPEPRFDLAYSGNTGATWSVTHVTLPENEGILAPNGRIGFADTRNGWMVLNIATAAFHAGTLLLTSDGGRTWRDSPSDPGGQGPIVMVTPEEGWMAGGGDDEELHVTRDGAKSWQTVTLPAPKEIYPAIYPTSDLPVFEDNKHGFVAVTYSGGGGARSAAVLFATDDGGRSWKPDRILANLEEATEGQRLPSTVADSTWITARASAHQPTLTPLSVGTRVRATIDPVSHFSGYFQVDQLSFTTATQGWLLDISGNLLSTTDGGATWTSLLPGPQPHVIQPHGSFIARQSMRSYSATAPSNLSPR
jgi:photosystem II stability/assembly factor-like uncharacterized protein